MEKLLPKSIEERNYCLIMDFLYYFIIYLHLL